MVSDNFLEAYGDTVKRVLADTQVTDRTGRALPMDRAIGDVEDRLARLGQGRMLFIGNGGSAGIASHLAIDFQKNAGLPSLCFTDGAALTCLGNDLGFDQIFAAPLSVHARPGDLLVAISSSGRSTDILNGVDAARKKGADIITLSSFSPDNPLRRLGDTNFYVHATLYGYVEIAHLAICHALLDLHMKLVTRNGAIAGPL